MTIVNAPLCISLEFRLSKIEVGRINSNISFQDTFQIVHGILKKVEEVALDNQQGVYSLMLDGGSGGDIPFDVGKAAGGKDVATFGDRFDAGWRDKVYSVVFKMVEYLQGKEITTRRRVVLWLCHVEPKNTKKMKLLIKDLEDVLLQRMAHHVNSRFRYSKQSISNNIRTIDNPLYRVRGCEHLRGSNKDCWSSTNGRLTSEEIELGKEFSKSFRW